MKTKFEWTEASSAPLGYPINVYRGGLQSSNGNFTSLYTGTIKGSWGAINHGMDRGVKSIPNHLHVIWVSHAENIFYEIDTPLDYDKMLKLFNEGFFYPSNGDDPTPKKEEFSDIVVGFAPGGVVIVWLSGVGRQIEIGRYQGKEVVIPADEIAGLNPPVSLLFEADYRRKIMYEFGIVPLEIVKANEGKPVPYGIWDTYRKQYNWYLNIDLPDGANLKKANYYYFNGEYYLLFGTSLINEYPNIIPNHLKWNVKGNKPVPKNIDFSWVDGNRYVGEIEFNETEIIQAFEAINDKNPDTEICLEIYVNASKTYANVKLVSGGDVVWISNNKIEITKTNYTY